ncbi:hypothetical protein NE865_14381 [Phthorimaea operculella]|nr:hypothetical protein NE865_14381 [Phthorimaea operculella]
MLPSEYGTLDRLGGDYNQLKVKYGPAKDGADKDYFYTIPKTRLEAEQAGWTQFIQPYDSKIYGLYMYCFDNFGVCPLYNQKGFVTGLQVFLPYDSFVAGENTAAMKMKLWQSPAAFGEPSKLYWTLPQVYVSQASLRSGAVPTAENGQILQDGGVYVHGLDDNIIQIPTTEAELAKNTLFTKQNCVPNMGTHYQYNMTSELVCENYLPWFVLVKNGKVIGSGFQFFAKFTEKQHNRPWFEDPQPYRQSTQQATPVAPSCLYDWAEQYNVISMHIYYIDEPWTITCEESDSIRPDLAPVAPTRR